jgi:purine-binding chemotaxis protein CheW
VVDLRCLLGRPGVADTPQSRILVVWIAHDTQKAIVGIKTDRVIEVTVLDDPDLRPMAEAELLRWSGNAIAGIGRRKGEVVTVLDLDRLFDRLDFVVDPEAVDTPEPVG